MLQQTCFGYLLESTHRGKSVKYPKHMFFEKTKIEKKLFFYSILLIKDSLPNQVHFNGNIFGNKRCCCNEASIVLLNHQDIYLAPAPFIVICIHDMNYSAYLMVKS